MTELSAERELTRAETAAYLREFAAKLDSKPASHDSTTEHHASEAMAAEHDRVTFLVGNDSTTINPPETIRFAVRVDSDSSLVGDETSRSVEFDLSWSADAVEETDEFQID